MDLKGLAWIGNIYEKFEAMCLEMEEVMYQDTVKYVENQVQTVGASVKRFYSEVMQDLDPESHMDPVKVAAANLSLNPYAHVEMKPKSCPKKDTCEDIEGLTDDYKVISGNNKTGVYKRSIARRRGPSSVNNSSPVSGLIAPIPGNVPSKPSFSQRRGSHEGVSSSADVTLSNAAIKGNSGEAKENMCDQVAETDLFLSGASVAETKLSMSSSKMKQAGSEISSASNCVRTEISAAGSCKTWRAVSLTDQVFKGDAGLSKSVEEEIVMSHKERLDEGSRDAAKNDNISNQEVEIIENFKESKLAETCVLVEEDILHFIYRGNRKHKSYKKKLQEAFSTKKRLTRKEYEKLAAQYKEQNINQESGDRTIPALGDSNAKISPVHDCQESEWELL